MDLMDLNDVSCPCIHYTDRRSIIWKNHGVMHQCEYVSETNELSKIAHVYDQVMDNSTRNGWICSSFFFI